jgi:DNA-binding CsgD family transcriptional regulator
MKEFFDKIGTDSGLENYETTYYLTNQIFDNIHAFVFVFNFEKKIPAWYNKYYETRMGYSLSELKDLTSERFFSLFHPDSLKVFNERMSSYPIVPQPDKKTIYKLKTKDESWIKLMISSNILKYTPDGKIKYLIGYGVEIVDDEFSKSLVKLNEIEHKSSHLLLFDKLSKRELEIITYIANCFTDKEIAEKLKISVNTTKTHRKRIINKLGLKNTASLVKFAIESNIV